MKKVNYENIADSLFNGSLPIDLDQLADRQNAVIRFEELEDNVSGMLLLSQKKNLIVINSKHHKNRQRFTIAHEIAHLILHTTSDEVFIDSRGTATIYFRSDDSSSKLKVIEKEANLLASCLLMPKIVLERYINDKPIDVNDDAAVKLLASKFEVSIQALSIRLTKLNLIH